MEFYFDLNAHFARNENLNTRLISKYPWQIEVKNGATRVSTQSKTGYEKRAYSVFVCGGVNFFPIKTSFSTERVTNQSNIRRDITRVILQGKKY